MFFSQCYIYTYFLMDGIVVDDVSHDVFIVLFFSFDMYMDVT